MAVIQISELYPTGSDLFVGSETFMNDLTDNEFSVVKGGATPTVGIAASSAPCGTIASAVVSGVAYTIWGK